MGLGPEFARPLDGLSWDENVAQIGEQIGEQIGDAYRAEIRSHPNATSIKRNKNKIKKFGHEILLPTYFRRTGGPHLPFWAGIPSFGSQNLSSQGGLPPTKFTQIA
jgi:hypothetical protein